MTSPLESIIRSASVSANASAHKHVNLQSQIRSRITNLEFQRRYLNKNAHRADPVIRELNIMLHHLVHNHLADPQDIYEQVNSAFRVFGTVKDHFDHIFGEDNWLKRTSGPMDEPLKSMMAHLRLSTQKSRASEWLFRVKSNHDDCIKKGWYCVFFTLTVRNSSYEEVFSLGSTAWRNYQRKLERYAAKAFCGSRALALGVPVSDYFSCVAVVEYGTVNDRAHIHGLAYFREIDFTDPNIFRKIANHKCVNELGSYWKFGFAHVYPYRTGYADVYAMRGWKVPQVYNKKLKKWTPDFRTQNGLTNYVCKYIFKSYLDGKRDKYQWRVRATRGFGLRKIKKALRRLTKMDMYHLFVAPTLLGREISTSRPRLLTLPSMSSLSYLDKELPKHLLRRLILRETYRRLKKLNTPISRLQKSWTMCSLRPSLVERWRILIHKKPMCNLRSITTIPTPKLKSTVISNFYGLMNYE